ncbi:ATP-binding cassette domain-containing protein, partial [uncultured Albimonas sp.]|uniref:ABC transporter ATP-binding protein n=1 Tax=uncultured Albimonas sp. TaxID=1331701 RepID=UPI0030EDA5DE
MIEIENLSIAFGTGASAVQAVRNVSFSVAEGESYGLVGESGSGKSTILRAIARINPHWSGTIRVNGRALSAKRSKAEARAMQMVFQDPYGALHPRHTVDAILREPLEIHGL